MGTRSYDFICSKITFLGNLLWKKWKLNLMSDEFRLWCSKKKIESSKRSSIYIYPFLVAMLRQRDCGFIWKLITTISKPFVYILHVSHFDNLKYRICILPCPIVLLLNNIINNASQLIIFANLFYVLPVRICAISAIGHHRSHFTCTRAAYINYNY